MSEQEQVRANATDQTSAPEAGSDQLPSDVAELARQLEQAKQERQEYLSLAQRTQADFLNYRRRVDQERGESLSAGKAQVALRILPVLDDFDRALKARPAGLAQDDWAQGIDLIARKLRAALEAEGITRIDALGAEFSPWEHEALLHAPSSAADAGKVTQVFREGYKQGDKVIRPAQVIVGKGQD